jgi:CelD/BcsL family acetyltransferase involved in cellulose biosynthesis
LRIVRDIAGLDELADAWAELAPRTDVGPTAQLAWIRACAESFSGDGRLRVVVVEDGGRVDAIAPFALSGDGSRLELLGAAQLYEPTDILARDEPSRRRLATALASLGWPLVLGRVPADSPTIPALREAFRRRGAVVVRDEGGAPRIVLDDTWSNPEGHLNSGRQSDIRRARRRAEKLGPLRVEILHPSPEGVGPLLEEALRIEAASWKSAAGTALAHDPWRRAFFERYAHEAARTGSLQLSLLRIGDRAAAMQIAVESDSALWLLKIGHDEEFSRCSPGGLLMLETIRRSAETGLKRYEFLGDADSWTRMWTHDVRSCVSLRAYPTGGRGARAASADALRLVRNKVVPPLARRASRIYVAGPDVTDAVLACERLAGVGARGIIAYWDDATDRPRHTAQQGLAALAAAAEAGLDAYVSIKATALAFSPVLIGEIAERGRSVQRRVHFDSMGPDVADPTLDLIRRFADFGLGITLPGRWRRSLDDADVAVELQLPVRVVKGQWADPGDPRRDARAGFLAVVDRLAGRARHVGVATHDDRLAREAVRRLEAAGTPCEVERLFGLPLARFESVPTRVYVAFGTPSLPYSLEQARRNPRLALAFARSLIAGRRGPGR